MPIVNGYCTLAQIKARLGIGVADTADDALLEAAVEAVSRAIDGWANRQFYASTQTRYYTARRCDRVLVDDLLAITALVTDDSGDGTYGTTWAVTDYLLGPPNNQLEPIPQPYWWIELGLAGNYSFPSGRRGVRVAGSWGFSSTTPKAVEEACLFQSALNFRSMQAPMGTSGAGDVLQEVRLTAIHPAAKRLLEPYRRPTV